MSLPRPINARARGFSFLEVMIALAMLLVGCLAILPMFAIGAQHLSQRRLSTDLRRLKPEVMVLVQQEVDRSGGIPRFMGAQGRKAYPLSLRGYDVLIEWSPSPFDGPGVVALAAIRRDGRVEHVLKPIAVLRSMFDTASTSPPAPAPAGGGARR